MFKEGIKETHSIDVLKKRVEERDQGTCRVQVTANILVKLVQETSSSFKRRTLCL